MKVGPSLASKPAEVDGIFHAQRRTPEGARLDMLATLIEAYEDERYDVPVATPEPRVKR